MKELSSEQARRMASQYEAEQIKETGRVDLQSSVVSMSSETYGLLRAKDEIDLISGIPVYLGYPVKIDDAVETFKFSGIPV